jgi:hypothetical protein
MYSEKNGEWREDFLGEIFWCLECIEKQGDCCEMCGDQTDREEWVDYNGTGILYCEDCYNRMSEVLITDGVVSFLHKKYEKFPDGFWLLK